MLALSMEMTNFQPNVSRICMSCPNLRPMFRCWWGWTQRVKAVRLHTRIDKNDMRPSASGAPFQMVNSCAAQPSRWKVLNIHAFYHHRRLIGQGQERVAIPHHFQHWLRFRAGRCASVMQEAGDIRSPVAIIGA